MHAHRLGAGQLAHDIDIVDAAIDDRDEQSMRFLCHIQAGAIALLVEVEAHDQRRPASGRSSMNLIQLGWTRRM